MTQTGHSARSNNVQDAPDVPAPALSPSVPARSLALPPAAWLLLALTAVIALLWSHHKMLDQDEIFVLQTDTVHSFRQLLAIQLHTPISLDPLVYHALAYAAAHTLAPLATGVFRVSPVNAAAFALRLPALLGFLLMQACVFLFTRNLFPQSSTREAEHARRAGLFAMLFPALTATLFYAAQARPYGLLLGFYALCMLAYQLATRAAVPYPRDASSAALQPRRLASLVTLALSIALTLNAHYFGVLLLLPLFAAEFVRTLYRRRLDMPLLAAIVSGCSALVFALPFQKAAAAFRVHYYNAGGVSLHAITQAYRSLFVDYVHAPLRTQHIAAALFVVLALVFLAALALRLPRCGVPAAELIFLLVLAALPFAGFVLARFVTHTIEVRYVLGAIVGISVLAALALTPLWRSRGGILALLLLEIAVAATGAARIASARARSADLIRSLQPTPALLAAVRSSADPHLYIQDMGLFEVASTYEPDPWLRTHLTLLYSEPMELRFDRHDTAALTAAHMRAFTAFPIVDFDTLRTDPRPHTLILLHSGWDWTDQALAEASVKVTPLGPALTGDAALVAFAR